ncbi:MAG TPA: DUF6513 domain-containing protein [Acidobacteriota bacterium]|nr:DUF6513 domain-containing protein [Acidobacteriota bacterium]
MPRYLLVTGKLAATFLGTAVEGMTPRIEHEIRTLPISVAALMNTSFIAKHLTGASGCDRVVIPGLCQGETDVIADKCGVEVVRGPADLKDLPAFFGSARLMKGYGDYRVKILAEITDAYRLNQEQIMARARYFRENGADIIDLGCPVDGNFPDMAAVIAALRAEGFSVSVDSFNPQDIIAADRAGVDYVLSISSRNLDLARGLRSRIVVVPDDDHGRASLERTIAQLEAWGISSYIIDPLLRPIGFGLAESIEDYIVMRRRYPHAEMLMGLGNLTELTGADTTGVTAVMTGILTELGIDYVLTTEKAAWARGAVKELDLARRLMYYSCRNKTLPRHIDDGLITIKDPSFESFSEDELRYMQTMVRDRNYRIFSDGARVFVFNDRCFIRATDMQAAFEQLNVNSPGQAFYLGRELQKAFEAVRLGKKYTQEEELRWGYLSGRDY